MLGGLRKSICVFALLVFLSSILPVAAEANIILKVIAANPSKENVQKVNVKAYLPKEVKPEDIVDKGDLEIAFDNQQGSYYVYGEYELKPGEQIERDIELRDIWIIPPAEIETLRAETAKLSDMLKNTEFSDRVTFLKNSIDSKFNQIIENQKNVPPNPERHISDYRDNLKVLESAKADLALARNLLSQVKPLPGAMVWRLIVAIIIFLGVLAASFYFIWQKQVKAITHDTFYTPPKKDDKAPDEEGSEEYKAFGDKTPDSSSGSSDIDDIIKKKDDE